MIDTLSFLFLKLLLLISLHYILTLCGKMPLWFLKVLTDLINRSLDLTGRVFIVTTETDALYKSDQPAGHSASIYSQVMIVYIFLQNLQYFIVRPT